jgi:hypothetical protein
MMTNKDCAELEKLLEIEKFRNAKLHQHNEKIEREILELRGKVKKLEDMQVDQFRNKGDL